MLIIWLGTLLSFEFMMSTISAFTVAPTSPLKPSLFTSSSNMNNHRRAITSNLYMSTSDESSGKNIVVISPPGGIGEVSAVESAKRGASVRWFVISPPDSSSSFSKVALSEDVLQQIDAAGGKIEFAGSDANGLLTSPDSDPNSSIPAISTWCGKSDGIISSTDVIYLEDQLKQQNEVMDFNTLQMIQNAIKVATKEASKMCANDGVRVAVTSIQDLETDLDTNDGNNGDGTKKNPVTQVFSSLLDGGKVPVPTSLTEAMSGTSMTNVVRLRHGQLFGLPESSVDASPFVGGPRRDPILRDEYTNRSIRLDSSIAIYANPALQSKTKSSRLSVGEAASLLALKVVPSSKDLDVCIASLRGSDPLSDEEWNTEVTRIIQSMVNEKAPSMSASSSSKSIEIFTTDFGSVPNTERLADWLATKWAPAILRTYDIAGIRVGARPVYASRTTTDGNIQSVEIVWQQLVDFEPKMVGKLQIEVNEDGSGLIARRVAGNPNQGYGKVSLKPLAGEDIIVRSLVDAAVQAVEKGLAIKKTAIKSPKITSKVRKEPAPQPVSTVATSGSLDAATATSTTDTVQSLASGPRSAGATRSAQRRRGTRKARTNDVNSNSDDQTKKSADGDASDSWQ